MTRKAILLVRSLTKTIHNRNILNEVNLEIRSGEICVLIGDNGVGKSIFLKCILGYESIDSGTIMIDDSHLQDRIRLRRITGYVPSDDFQPYKFITPAELFDFVISVHSLPKEETRHIIYELGNRLNICGHMNQMIDNLSFGTKKKVILLASILYKPKLLVCDEIFDGIDQKSVEEIKNIFKVMKTNQQSILITTHAHEHALDIADTLYRLENKKIIDDPLK